MSEKILYPNETEFNALLQEDGVVFVDFFATWCGPCKMLGPELEKLAEAMEGKAKVIKIDVDKEQGLAMKYQVQSVPTIMIFKNKDLVLRDAGFKPYPVLMETLNKYL
ncbi:MAG: thioredoxin [Erysipelotrichaceae bacterium]